MKAYPCEIFINYENGHYTVGNIQGNSVAFKRKPSKELDAFQMFKGPSLMLSFT